MRKINTPISKDQIAGLKVGDEVLLTGVIYTARDQAHKRLVKDKKLSSKLRGQIIYYCGPTSTPKGKTIGSCGPTTSSRMDKFTPALLKAGLKGMIGKGSRFRDAINAFKRYKAVYFLAPAGCGALLAKKVKSAKIVAYRDLGPEAIRKLKVKDFPLIVGVDFSGRSMYGSK